MKNIVIPMMKVVSKAIKLWNPRDARIKLIKTQLELLDSLREQYMKNLPETALTIKPKLGQKETKPQVSGEVSEKGVMGVSHIKRLSFDEGREYTKRQALKQLIAIEDHLRSGECPACVIEKHIPALELYAEEGMSYCVDKECDLYREIHKTIKELDHLIKTRPLSREEQVAIAEKLRHLRKELAGYSKEELAKTLDEEES